MEMMNRIQEKMTIEEKRDTQTDQRTGIGPNAQDILTEVLNDLGFELVTGGVQRCDYLMDKFDIRSLRRTWNVKPLNLYLFHYSVRSTQLRTKE